MGGKRKKDARSLSGAAQEALRNKAVKAVLSGRKQKEIAKLFEVTEEAICKWMKRYREGGMKKLKEGKRGRPGGGGKYQEKVWYSSINLDYWPISQTMGFYPTKTCSACF